MPEWIKVFLKQYGLHGAVVVIALLLAVQNVASIPWVRGLVMAEPQTPVAPTPAVTQAQMDEHIRQAKIQIEVLKEIKQQLIDNHSTQSTGSRLICLRLSKTDDQRDKCATIQ